MPLITSILSIWAGENPPKQFVLRQSFSNVLFSFSFSRLGAQLESRFFRVKTKKEAPESEQEGEREGGREGGGRWKDVSD